MRRPGLRLMPAPTLYLFLIICISLLHGARCDEPPVAECHTPSDTNEFSSSSSSAPACPAGPLVPPPRAPPPASATSSSSGSSMSAVAAAMAAAASVKNSSDQTALIYHASIDNSDTQDADIGIEREDLQSNLEAAQTVDPEYVSFDAASHYAGGKILVLGAGGVIGRALIRYLHLNGLSTLSVLDRRHVDLRTPNALNRFDNENISFAFFLACEVGGSKFLDNSDANIQQSIIESNLLIYQTVFPYFSRRKIPFLFTSSSLQAQPTAYGAIKRLGERWVDSSNGLGRSVRLWNVYGDEPIGVRSHVLTDWVSQCVTNGLVRAATDGFESRQFLHADDCASFLGAFLRPTGFARLPLTVDISSGAWTSLRALADLVIAESQRRRPSESSPCQVLFAEKKAVVRTKLVPRLSLPIHSEWHQEISLERGIALMFDYYEAAQTTLSQQDSQQQQTSGQLPQSTARA